MLTLGIDTSNYATSLAVFDTDAGEVVCDCKKFLPVKEGQLGLRQSDALFHHTAALPAMLEELSGKADLTKVAAVGVSAKPRPVEGSYMPCFLAGVSAATAFALSRGLPLVQLTHQQGHIAAALSATGLPGLTCRLSGLANQCTRRLAEGQSAAYVCKYCLLCVGETLVRMANNALAEHPGLPVVFAGGVMSSDLIRTYVTNRVPGAHFVPGKFASDNAIGISILAAEECGAWPTTSM